MFLQCDYSNSSKDDILQLPYNDVDYSEFNDPSTFFTFSGKWFEIDHQGHNIKQSHLT
jgi:hypothetical protein